MNPFISPHFLKDIDILTLTQFNEQSPWYELGIYLGYSQYTVLSILETVFVDLGIILIESGTLSLCDESVVDWNLPLIIEEISQWGNLTGIFLRCGRLTQLCPEIGQLINLTELFLYGGHLTQLCPEIGKLVKLTKLYIDNTQLTKLCPEIGQLVNLITLYLINNKLTHLCPEIGQLSSLTHLYLHQHLNRYRFFIIYKKINNS